MSVWLLIAAVVVGTWNGNWFPSGRAEHRANPAVEAATTLAAAKMLSGGIARMDPLGTNDVILCLNEIRGPRAASNLVSLIGRKGLRVVAVSGYRRRDRFDSQQDVIATTLPVVRVGWERFAGHGADTPPRGYVYAELVVMPSVTGIVYATHLKSNYGASNPDTAAANRRKRTFAMRELVAAANRHGRRVPVVIAGDFNADRWRGEFAGEPLFGFLDEAGFIDLLGLLPPKQRGTHPSRTYGDSALDYIMVRGLDSVACPRIIPNDRLSDHQALFTLLL